MSNEHLFHGKRLDNGEWVEGDLVHNVYKMGDTCIGTYGSTVGMHQVDPETVGGLTDTRDKNGKRVFEGDILASRYDDLYPENITLEVVVWAMNAWRTKQIGSIEHDPELMEEDFLPYSEVVGNIHDNPNLVNGDVAIPTNRT